MSTREAVVAFDALYIYISSLLGLAPQHAVNLFSIISVMVAYSVCHTAGRKKIAGSFSPIAV